MADHALVREVIESERVSHFPDLVGRPGEEVPPGRVRLPLRCILGQPLRRVARRVERDAEQHEVAAVPSPEPVLQHAEMVGHAIAELRKRAARVDEVHHDDLAPKLRQRNALVRLISEGEIGHRLIELQLRRCVRGPQ